MLSGVRLAGGVVLLLPATPDVEDLAEIEAAARPLLEFLAARRLLTADPLTADPNASPNPHDGPNPNDGNANHRNSKHRNAKHRNANDHNANDHNADHERERRDDDR
jgi:hypothetical protein